MYSGEYLRWLAEQTPERKRASLLNMEVCKRLGEVQREAPHSQEAALFAEQVAAHYAKYP